MATTTIPITGDDPEGAAPGRTTDGSHEPAEPAATNGPATTDGPGATVLELPVGRTAKPRRPAPRRGRRHTAPPATRPTPPGPDPARLAAALVRAAAEVAAGRRPLWQLEPVLAPTLMRRLATQVRSGTTRPEGPTHIRRVVTASPTPSGAVEATVLVEVAGRVTALAVRLERHRGTWRATELTAPESGYRPLRTRSDPLPGRGPDAFDEAEAEARAAITPRRDNA